ncbi:DUF4350 domain-containing protein [Pseudoalteromonas byunsanensis]|uniref:DUF4350 domain-containing protein n=1 Tax=Pseudoalteromonas byunsanensis TaxID=327939 RepID=UPI000ABC7CCB|nr:DUF4350 domain-containing protein [Pseudoalteromonas byunsanensis]
MAILKRLLFGVLIFNLVGCDSNDGLPQQADPDFIPKNTTVTFNDEQSPVVVLDQAHYNFHTATGRYKPFVQVLKSDGYTLKQGKKAFTSDSLKDVDVLVIANALHKDNSRNWDGPFHSAFTQKEVDTLQLWVKQGGALLLIADHIPFPKAIEPLAQAFGFEFVNGHVQEVTYNTDNQLLKSHEITDGPVASKQISQVRTLGGDAFKAPDKAVSLLQLPQGAWALVPDKPFVINQDTKKQAIGGWSQGAVLELGKGRVAVFAEAAMFTSQVYLPTGKKMGVVSPEAEQNEQFLLNVMHWLSGTR